MTRSLDYLVFLCTMIAYTPFPVYIVLFILSVHFFKYCNLKTGHQENYNDQAAQDSEQQEIVNSRRLIAARDFYLGWFLAETRTHEIFR